MLLVLKRIIIVLINEFALFIDSYILFKLSTDKIDNFLKEREFNGAIDAVINNANSLISTMIEEQINDKIIKIVPIYRNTDGE